MVIWVTGLSGTGKTTLCQALYRVLKPQRPEVVFLDGDAMRATVSDDLGYEEADRRIQVGRVQRLAKLLSDQGLLVLVAVVYSHPELLRWNRQQLSDYVEVYVEASLETLRQRDSKGLYATALARPVPHVVGVDIPWHAPMAPDLVINTDTLQPPEQLAARLISSVPQLARLIHGHDDG